MGHHNADVAVTRSVALTRKPVAQHAAQLPSPRAAAPRISRLSPASERYHANRPGKIRRAQGAATGLTLDH
jgi:hypothetical protein